MNYKARKITVIGMLCALAFVAAAFCRIPAVAFLKYEPKDVVIAIGGLLYGPLAAVAISVVSSVVEMVTVSSTGPIGLLMNIIGSVSFACTVAIVFRYKRSFTGLLAGLAAGVVLMTVFMLLWNWLFVPLYLETPREAVEQMLLPVFLPFNLIKGGINAVLVCLLYKPVVVYLKRQLEQ